MVCHPFEILLEAKCRKLGSFLRLFFYCWRSSKTPTSIVPHGWPASWSSDQSFWLLIMRSRVRFPVLLWEIFLEGEDPHGDHGLGSLVELRYKVWVVWVEFRYKVWVVWIEFRYKAPPGIHIHIHISPSTSSGQRNCASWASVTLRPQKRERRLLSP
jgi:hypothetical protein